MRGTSRVQESGNHLRRMLEVSVHDAYPLGASVLSRPASTAPPSPPVRCAPDRCSNLVSNEPNCSRRLDHVRRVVITVIDEQHHGVWLNLAESRPSSGSTFSASFRVGTKIVAAARRWLSSPYGLMSPGCRPPYSPLPFIGAPASLSFGTLAWPFAWPLVTVSRLSVSPEKTYDQRPAGESHRPSRSSGISAGTPRRYARSPRGCLARASAGPRCLAFPTAEIPSAQSNGTLHDGERWKAIRVLGVGKHDGHGLVTTAPLRTPARGR